MMFFGSEPPDWALANVAEFRAANPAYDLVFWTEPPRMPSALEKAKAWTNDRRFQADLVRYWILYEHGGLYVDTDCRPVRPFDEAVLLNPCFVASHRPHTAKHGEISNYFMGSEPRSPGIATVLSRCLDQGSWPSPGKFFHVENTVLTSRHSVHAGITILPWFCVRMVMSETERKELVTRRRIPADPAYIKHYRANGESDLDNMYGTVDLRDNDDGDQMRANTLQQYGIAT
jgi:hypothetical protein